VSSEQLEVERPEQLGCACSRRVRIAQDPLLEARRRGQLVGVLPPG
jgi:hypothetical protein